MDLTSHKEIHMTITCHSDSGYGFELDPAQHPLRVSTLSPGSSAFESGLRKGDLLLMLNGHNVSKAPLVKVKSIMSYTVGSPITIKIARLDKEKSNKTKPPIVTGKGLQSYRDAVGDAVKSAQNALDILSDIPSSRTQHITIDLRESGSDHSSPPISSPEHSDDDYDPLVDFTHDIDQDSSGHTSAKFIGNVLKTQQALRGLKDISETTEERKVEKRKPLVSTEASFEIKSTDKPVPTHDVMVTKQSKNLPPDHTSAKLTENVLKAQQALRGIKDISETTEERKVEKRKPLVSTEASFEIKSTDKPVLTHDVLTHDVMVTKQSKNLPPDHTSAKLTENVLKAQQALRGIKDISETTEERKVEKRKPLVSTEASFEIKTTDKPVPTLPSHNVMVTKQSKDLPPDHTSAKLIENVLKAQQALRGIKDISETERKVEKREPLVSTEASFEVKTTDKPVSTHDVMVTKDSIQKPETHNSLSPPPPIPPYNPVSPDRFLLSNKPEYQFEVKKQRHYYDEVSLDDKQTTKITSPKKLVKPDVPVTSRLHVTEPTHGQRSFVPVVGITVSLDPIRASKGLPSSVHSWKIDHVSRWLQQLSPSMSDLYGACFSQHSITGHTLLHLNQSKLQSMGVTSKEHRMQLGMSIARLRLNHEQKELERLSSQVTWL